MTKQELSKETSPLQRMFNHPCYYSRDFVLALAGLVALLVSVVGRKPIKM